MSCLSSLVAPAGRGSASRLERADPNPGRQIRPAVVTARECRPLGMIETQGVSHGRSHWAASPSWPAARQPSRATRQQPPSRHRARQSRSLPGPVPPPLGLRHRPRRGAKERYGPGPGSGLVGPVARWRSHGRAASAGHDGRRARWIGLAARLASRSFKVSGIYVAGVSDGTKCGPKNRPGSGPARLIRLAEGRRSLRALDGCRGGGQC